MTSWKGMVPQETEVQTKAGQWYRLRILPYRTLNNVIEGVAITFIEITETVHTREALRKANGLARMAVIVRDAHDAITMQDLDGHILAWNAGAARMYGWSEAEALAMNVRDRIPAERRVDALDKIRQLSQAKVLEPYRTQRLAKSGAVLAVSIVSTALVDEQGSVYGIATTEWVSGGEERAPA
ncbi:MAG: PAS domain S-box protein [Acidobacteria bacterium]|nr:PAS domain S-box protein [Acidobacteriota bacterium]